MEPKPTPALEAPAAANPVMDVVAPPAPDKAESADHAAEADPVDQLAAQDHAEQAKKNATAPAKKADNKPAAPTPKTPKNHNGTGLAITATVIIVLGLAVLATYAYLQSSK